MPVSSVTTLSILISSATIHTGSSTRRTTSVGWKAVPPQIRWRLSEKVVPQLSSTPTAHSAWSPHGRQWRWLLKSRKLHDRCGRLASVWARRTDGRISTNRCPGWHDRDRSAQRRWTFHASARWYLSETTPESDCDLGAAQGGEPLLLDKTLSVVAGGKLLVQTARGEPIPEGWMIDAEGQPLTDPNAFRERPAGHSPLCRWVVFSSGIKGFGLGVMIDAIAGGLSWAGCSREQPTRGASGIVMFAIKIGDFIDLADYEQGDCISYGVGEIVGSVCPV